MTITAAVAQVMLKTAKVVVEAGEEVLNMAAYLRDDDHLFTVFFGYPEGRGKNGLSLALGELGASVKANLIVMVSDGYIGPSLSPDQLANGQFSRPPSEDPASTEGLLVQSFSQKGGTTGVMRYSRADDGTISWGELEWFEATQGVIRASWLIGLRSNRRTTLPTPLKAIERAAKLARPAPLIVAPGSLNPTESR